MKIESLSGDTFAVLEQSMRKRSTDSYPEQEKAVSAILEDVRTRGDAAVIDCEARFDHCALTPETLLVTDREIEEAYKEVDPDFVRVIISVSPSGFASKTTSLIRGRREG